ncbi:MAG: M48 family metalloprotease [Rhodoferax sp.]
MNASHRNAFVGWVFRGGVVPLAAEGLTIQHCDDGLAEPLLCRLGHEIGHVGRGGVIQQCVVALHGAEFLQIAAAGVVFVQIHHNHRAIVPHHLGESASFWRVQ